MDVDDHRLHGGQPWPIDNRLGFFSSTRRLARAPVDRALDDATGMRARMPHGRAEMAVHGVMARMTTKGPQEMTVRARHGVVADLSVEANTHFVPGPQMPGSAACRETASAPKPTSSASSRVLTIMSCCEI